ncbi:unnamed protein product [Rotaria sordida]|uniref:EGF-like domain-containing protein n=2 Tax=Rotaria sordida TaxID=392033 RepID=A0A815NNC6_9BILA|nr:unnamed protein product [Rotaria sordida]
MERNGGKYDRSINGYEFDTQLYETEISSNFCDEKNVFETVMQFDNKSGYVFCTGPKKGIQQLCPPGTEVSFQVGGCVNKTTNTTVFPAGSRCALRPCENNGLCFDLSSADAYHCACRYPYTGVHCQIQERIFSPRTCGNITSKIVPYCLSFTSDKALPYICVCQIRGVGHITYALNNCHSEKLFHKVCDGKVPFVGALPFTNKAFYICKHESFDAYVLPCDLHHVWNDTQKECVPE